MIVEPIKLVQIAVSSDHIFGLDENGIVWYRKKLPYTTTSYNYNVQNKKENEEEEEAKKVWKRLSMMGRIAGEEIPPSKQVPPEIVGPAVDVRPEPTTENARSLDDDGIETDFSGMSALTPTMFGIDGFEE